MGKEARSAAVPLICILTYAYDKTNAYKVIKTSRYAFRDCTSITSIIIPNTLEFISLDSFWNTSVTELFIPKSIKTLDDNALSTMQKLVIVIFEKGISLTFGENVFYDCINLNSITFPSNIIYPPTLFFGRTNLSSVFLCSKTVILNDNNHFLGAVRKPSIFVTKSYSGDKFFGVPVHYMENEEYFCPHNKNSCNCNIILYKTSSIYMVIFLLN
ncbi:cell surface protein, putative [Trichomonas vaginalis G3]|uniref:Cell surface protein, putative n=1 Tax=Trichomonas vaginalis (strain ATCC PRA-98 / G3) TaxID=412133 RepID=A2E3I7_TRIV3|nr:cell surface protein, putative [Trichomonas vaginalis G3]|eukprot:XP_001324976.1 cell surface protein [Trichomonas vaginalis G3]